MFCSARVSFYPVFSAVKWLCLPSVRTQCLWERGQSALHSTGWQPQNQPCSCCTSLKKVSVSSYKFADVTSFPPNRPGAPELSLSPSAFPYPCTLLRACWKGFLFVSQPMHALNQCNEMLARSQNWACSWKIIASGQDFAFYWYMNLFWSTACKSEKEKQNLL